MLLTLAASGGVFTALISGVQAWLTRLLQATLSPLAHPGWAHDLSRRGLGQGPDPLACLKPPLRAAMAAGQAHDELPSVVQPSAGELEESKPSGLEALARPAFGQPPRLQQGVQVEGKPPDGPPGGILANVARGPLPPREILLPDPRALLAFAPAAR